MRATADTDATPKTATLYTRLGGAPAVRAAVDIFYDKMLADERVAGFFKDTNMQEQRAHQVCCYLLSL